MDNNTGGNKRNNTSSPVKMSTNKVQKTQQSQDFQIPTISPQKMLQMNKLPGENPLTRDDKMHNIAKLRQQFIDEVENIDLSIKESIKNLKVKISEVKKKDNILKQKLKEENKLICKQSKVIYDKEQENKILRLKVQELYEYQKIVVENLEDITTTINVYENLSEKLTLQYDSLILMQQNDNKLLNEELNKITPDDMLCIELEKISLNLNEQEQEDYKYRNEYNALQSEVEMIKKKKDKEYQKIGEIDKRIHELEAKRTILKQNSEQDQKNLLEEINKLKNETNAKAKEVVQFDENIHELKSEIDMSRNDLNKTEEKMKALNDEVMKLTKENEELDQVQYKDQENSYKKLEDQLKSSKLELESIKQQENQAMHILQNKISDINTKLESYKDLENKLKRLDLDITKEGEIINQMNKEYEQKLSGNTDQNKMHNNKINKIKEEINKTERKNSEYEKMLSLLQKETVALNEQYEAKLKEVKVNAKKVTSVSHYNMPHLFTSEAKENEEKKSYRRKLYTPTFADDDLEIDSLPIDEQFNHLTQTTSLSQPDSPDKQKKFFKRSSNTQSQKKEGIPRVRGKGKKN